MQHPPIFRLTLLASLTLAAGCVTGPSPRPGEPLSRHGDEIVAAGKFFRTGTPVVLWLDPGGYDAYRPEPRFGENGDESEDGDAGSRRHYNLRREGLTEEEVERVRGGGWDLPLLQGVVDQVVFHYDAAGTSRQCFNILHDHRGLSAHFLVDLDGTIYQTLDLKERAWHATTSNTRSIGIEIANIGAYESGGNHPLDDWYTRDSSGRTRITIPERFGDGGLRTPDFTGRPARDRPVIGTIQGRQLIQYDFTPEQYEALIHLTAALWEIFPKIDRAYPQTESGEPIPRKLPDEELERYRGLIGHFHIQDDKVDPGPAFDWVRVTEGARRLLGGD